MAPKTEEAKERRKQKERKGLGEKREGRKKRERKKRKLRMTWKPEICSQFQAQYGGGIKTTH